MEVAEAEAVPLPPPAAKGLSLVEDVLACSGRLEREGLGHRISRLSCRVEELKGEVCSMISQRYVEFLPSMQNAKELESQVEELSGNIDQLKSRIENEVQQDLNVAIAEFAELKQQLERDTLVLCVLKQLQEFDAALKQVNALLPQKKYVPAACHLNQARRALKTMESRRGFELKILKALSREVTLQTQNVLYLLGQEWQQMAVWKLPQAQETGSLEAAVGTELHLRTVLPEAELVAGVAVASVLQAFAILGELRLRFKHFSQSLLKHILRPLVCHASLRPLLEEQPNVVILRLETAGSDRGHAPPVEVFAKVKLVFEALHKYHLGVSLEPCIEEGSNSVPALAEVLGDLIWKELSDCLIHDCLVHSIPNSSSKLGQYIEVIKATEEFEKALKDMQFLKEESTDLLTYARNVNCHFANKKCQDVIVAARMLMTSEIHNTVKVSPDSSVILPKLPDPGAGDQVKALEAPKALPKQVMNLENETKLSRHTFSFPACRISDSVQKLMALAYQTLQEASDSTDQCCIQLFYAVRNMFQLFCDVVPTYHKENLRTLPQLAAVHHNNCMYVAHHLLTLGHRFRGRPGGETATFVDLVPAFRRLATECFLAQMRVQKGELLERLSGARNLSNMDDEDNSSAASKAVRQVLHQLRRLGKVWQDVLPVNVYCKAMGTLLSTAVGEIAHRIIALEDISAENADRLHALCQTVVDEGPSVFAPLLEEEQNKRFREEVPVYVPKWMMFRELMLVLQASLQDIVDRWADGKGPLAAQFSPSEVRNLIRALFQNTERRAAALGKIK
ncbi:centromere/kinetochore protein zw10 homolog isoform X1 [Varanus komodoensis]|uniref:centromere/kinetochore protein zw10 homolog isoform X1 n=1 Tax=Varanus komodoensis TaxID=61221 RepID=UPI001CF7E6BF|nr:centromere/kinetochore protein zw10 homolog isoform X1 [Varanus komodoensis]